MLDNTIVFEDEKGNEERFRVVLTFTHPQTNESYVVVEKEDATDDTVYAYRYDEENNLYPIESDEEWALVEEVLDSFNQVDDEEEN